MKIEVKIIHTLDDNPLLLGINKRTTLINKIIDFIRGQDEETIIANHNRRHYMISLGTCITFYTAKKKVYTLTQDQKELLVSKRLYELEETLPEAFIRISNTEIINLNFVKEFQINKTGIIIIYFKNGYQTSSSRRYLKKVKERLQ